MASWVVRPSQRSTLNLPLSFRTRPTPKVYPNQATTYCCQRTMVGHTVFLYASRLVIFANSSVDGATFIIAGQVFRLLCRGPFSLKSDDTFPSVSDILGLKPNHFKENPKSQTSPTSTVLTHPRAPLRATTFDGKPLFISRKPKTIVLKKVQNQTPCLSSLTYSLVVFDIPNGKPARCAYP